MAHDLYMPGRVLPHGFLWLTVSRLPTLLLHHSLPLMLLLGDHHPPERQVHTWHVCGGSLGHAVRPQLLRTATHDQHVAGSQRVPQLASALRIAAQHEVPPSPEGHGACREKRSKGSLV